MAQVCETIVTGYDESGDPITDEYCYDDGSNENTVDASANVDPSWSGWGDAPGAEGSTTEVDSKTGNITYKYDDGSTLTVGPDGNPVSNTESPDAKGNSVAYNRALAWATKTFGSTAGKVFSNMMANPGASLLGALAAAKAFSGVGTTGGYNTPIPKMQAVTQQIQYNDPNRRPGSAGRQYTTDPIYVKEGDTASLDAAKAISNAQAQGILAAYKPAAPEVNRWEGKYTPAWNTPATPTAAGASAAHHDLAESDTPPAAAGTPAPRASAEHTTPPAGIAAALPVVPTQNQLMDPNYRLGMATGGVAALAGGGQGRYLQGATDGMADKIPTSIDGDQPAALSHGEFVIPADVVSHLGNGNSDAGAKKLYQMMDRIRQARTGTKQQGKRINPDHFMPGGLAAAYAGGGEVRRFTGGGTTDPTSSSVVTTNAAGVPLDRSVSSGLSPWAGDYVTNMLAKAEALGNAPMQTYGGPLSAGASDLQNQAFAGLSATANAGYKPATFTNQYSAPDAYKATTFTNQYVAPDAYKANTSDFDTTAAQQYMNPYLMTSLQPQMDEARRQSEISQMGNAAKAVGAGAFGGSRSALMNAESQRALGANLANVVGTGFNTAYDKAMTQFNADQARKMAENQFGYTQGMTAADRAAQYGLSAQQAQEASKQFGYTQGMTAADRAAQYGQQAAQDTEASRRSSADFGLKSLSDLLAAGNIQRDIESQGIAADKKQWEEQQARPYTNLEFQRKMLEGLPIGTTTSSTNQDAISKLSSDVTGIAALYDKLSKLIPS